MELVKEAATHSGLTLGDDLSVLIDVGAERLYDQVRSIRHAHTCTMLRLVVCVRSIYH